MVRCPTGLRPNKLVLEAGVLTFGSILRTWRPWRRSWVIAQVSSACASAFPSLRGDAGDRYHLKAPAKERSLLPQYILISAHRHVATLALRAHAWAIASFHYLASSIGGRRKAYHGDSVQRRSRAKGRPPADEPSKIIRTTGCQFFRSLVKY